LKIPIFVYIAARSFCFYEHPAELKVQLG